MKRSDGADCLRGGILCGGLVTREDVGIVSPGDEEMLRQVGRDKISRTLASVLGWLMMMFALVCHGCGMGWFC